MAGLFSRLFGSKSETPSKEPPKSEAEKTYDTISNQVMDLSSKLNALTSDQERLRGEIKQAEQERIRLENQYNGLDEGLEKDMAMEDLKANLATLDGLKSRIGTLGAALSQTRTLLQTLKQARERLRAAMSAGMPPQELSSLVGEIAMTAAEYDRDIAGITSFGNELSPLSTGYGTDEAAERIKARMAAKKGAVAGAASANDTPQAPSAPATSSVAETFPRNGL